MTPHSVPIVCARAPRHIVYVPAVRHRETNYSGSIDSSLFTMSENVVWVCSWCGARVKVVA